MDPLVSGAMESQVAAAILTVRKDKFAIIIFIMQKQLSIFVTNAAQTVTVNIQYMHEALIG